MPISFDEYRTLVEANISALQGLSAEAYPNLFRMLMKHNSALYMRIMAILRRMNEQDNQTLQDGYWFVFFSMRDIAGKYPDAGKSYITWYHSIILFMCWGLLVRMLPTADSPNKYMRKAYEQMQQHGRNMPTAFYSVLLYSPEQLSYADRQAERWIKSGATFTSFSKETIIEVYGQPMADSIYGDGRRKTKRHKDIEQMLVRTAKEQIKALGYTTKQAVMQEVSRNLKAQLLEDESFLSSISELLDTSSEADVHSWRMVSHVFKSRGNLILQRSNLAYASPTRKQRECYGLEDGTWIITQNPTKRG